MPNTSGSSGSITKLLGILKNFLRSLPTPLEGFDIREVKVKEQGDEYSSFFQFQTSDLKDERGGESITDIHGNKIDLEVLLSTTNSKDVLAPLLSGMNKLSSIDADATTQNEDNNVDLLNVLLGEQRIDKESGAANNVITEGYGLLGLDLQEPDSLGKIVGTYQGEQWSWGIIANKLRYSLECKSPGKNYGAIQNQELKNCQNLISEYLVMTDQIKNADEVKVLVSPLIAPLLNRIQIKLVEYFTAAYKKYVDNTQTEKDESNVWEDKDELERKAQEDEAERQRQAEQAANDAEWEEAMERAGRGEGNRQATPGSKHIDVKLKKIQGSTGFDLMGLQSNYSPSETLDDLEDIIYQEEFINSLGDEPQSFAIEVDDDGYDISQCDNCEISCGEGIGNIMKSGIKFYRNLYILHWMAKGNDMMKLHLLTEDMYSELIQEIDTLGELMVEKCGTVISPSFGCDYLEIKNYDFQEGIHIIEDYIQEYLDCIDYAYPNQTSDVQSTFDEWIRYWNKQKNYFVTRQEET